MWMSLMALVLFAAGGNAPSQLVPALTLEKAECSGTDLLTPINVAATVSVSTDLKHIPEIAVRLVRSTAPARCPAAISETVWKTVFPAPKGPDGWPANKPVPLPVVYLPALPHLWPGTYTLTAYIPGTAWADGFALAELKRSASDLPDPCQAEIKDYRGAPAIWIDDKPQFAYAFLMADGDRDKEYKQFADTGGRFFSTDAGIGNTPDGFHAKGLDTPFFDIIDAQPDALIFPRVSVTAPDWWMKAHPDEAAVLDDGSKGPQSMFSDAWREDACRWIEEYCRYLRTSPYADHVMGIHLCSGMTAEWQAWGLWDNRRGDTSAPAKRAWKEYLYKKYGTDAALAKAWARETTLDTADMPARKRLEMKTEFQRMPPEHQDIIDYYDFYWRGTARAMQDLAAAAKRGGGRDFLVGFFYGYELQYGGKTQDSQHLGMRTVLDCPDIDFFCSPAMYSNRAPGGSSTFMSFTESVKLHGKFWFDEADNRTHLAKDTLARAANAWESAQVLKREYAHVVASQTGLWWFDMQGGWYGDAAILKLFRQQRSFGENNPGEWKAPAQVAVFIDDRSLYRLAPNAPFLAEGLPEFVSKLAKLGAPYHTYLLSDLPDAPEYKMYLFLVSFDLTDHERHAIEKLKEGDHTLVFFGPAGIGRIKDGRVDHDPAASKKLMEGGTGKALSLVWTATPSLPLQDLRALAREAGVHVYSSTDDAFYAGNGVIALHAAAAGEKILHFRGETHLTELFADPPFEWTGSDLTMEMKEKETRVFAAK